MNVLLEVASTVATYAPVVVHWFGVGLVMLLGLTMLLMLENPGTTCVVASLLAIWMIWSFNRRARMFMNWFLFYPIQRRYHRFVAKPIRRLVGGIMAKWKKWVVINALDDTLESLCYDKHVISKAEYRRMLNTIGKALQGQYVDLCSRSTHPHGVRKRVEGNIAEIKAGSPKNVIPGKPEVKVDLSYKPLKPGEANLAFLRHRKMA